MKKQLQTDSAASLFRRARAIPVSLGNAAIDAILGGGLKPHDTLLLYGPSASGKTELLLTVVASHVVAGGRVDFVLTPTASPFNITKFLAILESHYCRRVALQSSSAGGPTRTFEDVLAACGGPDGFIARLQEIASRVVVHQPATTAEYLVCLDDLSSTEQDSSKSESTATRLVVLDQLGAPSCCFAALERVACGEFPLGGSIDSVLTSLGCALIVAETTIASADSIRSSVVSSAEERFRYFCQLRCHLQPPCAAVPNQAALSRFDPIPVRRTAIVRAFHADDGAAPACAQPFEIRDDGVSFA